MEKLNNYDPEMQMFRSPVKEADQNHLLFMRELVESGRLQGDTGAAVVIFEAPKQSMQESVASNGDY